MMTMIIIIIMVIIVIIIISTITAGGLGFAIMFLFVEGSVRCYPDDDDDHHHTVIISYDDLCQFQSSLSSTVYVSYEIDTL